MREKDFETIKKVIEYMKKEGIQEIEIRKPFFRLKLVKENREFNFPQTVSSSSPVIEIERKEEEKKKELVEDKNIYILKSPLVGTFYRAPSPEANPYVETGSYVKKGQIVCIIEAMKIMNEIESEVSGKIVEILVENNEPVEYGQALFKIEVTQ